MGHAHSTDVLGCGLGIAKVSHSCKLVGTSYVTQVAGIVKAESNPASTCLLKDIKGAGILLYAPDLIQVKPEQRTGQHLVDDLVANQGDGLFRMAMSQLFEHGQKAGLNVSQAFAAGKMNLTGCTLPLCILLRIDRSRFRVCQALEPAVVDIDQAVVRLDLQAQLPGQWFNRLPCAEEWARIER